MMHVTEAYQILLQAWKPYYELQQQGEGIVRGDQYFRLSVPCEHFQKYQAKNEPKLLQIEDARDIELAVTVNAYRALCLNTQMPMFVDVDQVYFGQTSLLTEDLVLATTRRILDSARVYQTHAGWRILTFDPPADPGSSLVWELMDSLGADHRYMKLCEIQKCYRARLTPKPWRNEEQVCYLLDEFGDSYSSMFEVQLHDLFTLRPWNDVLRDMRPATSSTRERSKTSETI